MLLRNIFDSDYLLSAGILVVCTLSVFIIDVIV